MANFGEITSNIAIGAGQSIRRNALDNAFEAYSPTGSLSIDGLTDVSVSAPQIGQGIVYNGSQWTNSTMSRRLKVETGTTDDVVFPDDDYAIIEYTNASDITITLSGTSTNNAMSVLLVKKGTGNLIIQTNGGATLQGATSLNTLHGSLYAYYKTSSNIWTVIETPAGSATLGNTLTPTLDQTITDNYGLFSPEYYEIASGTFLECGTESILEIG